MSIWETKLEDTQESHEYPTLPAGEYFFEVVKASGKEFEPKPGGRLPRCAEIDLQLRIETEDGTVVTVFDRLYSAPKNLWKMTEFAKCIDVFKAGMTPGDLLKASQGCFGKAFVKLIPAHGPYAAKNEIGKYIAHEPVPDTTNSENLPF